jgi:hypothetical protein
MKVYLRGGVESSPGYIGRPGVVTVMHTDGVDLLLVTLNAVGGTNVVTEDPGLTSLGGTTQRVGCTTSKK